MKKTILLALVILSSCVYHSEEDLYPDWRTSCDTTNITFSGTIFPIIDANCVICHSGPTPSNNMVLTDYTAISTHANIAVGHPGSLYGAITHDPNNFPMPKNGAQLSDCNILKIKKWIDAGTPNN